METNDDDDRAVDLNGLDGEAGDQDVTNGSSAPYPATDDGHGFVEGEDDESVLRRCGVDPGVF